ncbi:MAG TPA: insulinase family protein, partial [Fibrobacteraceae bacterium]|nr:insulinase family protein [Fibrobacteraceae bacterium]
ASLVRSLTDMENVATMLAWYEMYGDYHIFLNWANALEKVTAQEVQKAAQETFSRNKATIGILTKENAK